MKHTKKLLAALITGAMASSSVLATNGYAPHGIGMKSKGMGGVSIAHQGDAVAVGGNPAGSAWLDDRVDVGIDLFRPIRESEVSGSFVPFFNDKYDGSGTKLFPIPEFGYRRGIDDQIAFALSLYGNGGMNTDYKDGIPLFNINPNTGEVARTGINLSQLFVVPSMSYKLNSNHSIGVGLNLVAQGFKAKGLQNFTGFSLDPDKVTNNDTDWSYGAGLRIGWMGKVSDTVTLGATYQSPTWMSKFDEYKGLFAEQGKFNVPANFGGGIAVQASPNLMIAADIMRIQYSQVDSISNPLANLNNCQFDPAYCLGGDKGPGFGWEDMTVYKIGFEYALNPTVILRAGYNHGKAPIPSSETLFNMVAPATVEDHFTLGATWVLDNDMEVTAAYMHARETTIQGENSIPPNLGGGEADISMYQDSLGIAVSWKL
jgi:long-chain fatty acid transport protein